MQNAAPHSTQNAAVGVLPCPTLVCLPWLKRAATSGCGFRATSAGCPAGSRRRCVLPLGLQVAPVPRRVRRERWRMMHVCTCRALALRWERAGERPKADETSRGWGERAPVPLGGRTSELTASRWPCARRVGPLHTLTGGAACRMPRTYPWRSRTALGGCRRSPSRRRWSATIAISPTSSSQTPTTSSTARATAARWTTSFSSRTCTSQPSSTSSPCASTTRAYTRFVAPSCSR